MSENENHPLVFKKGHQHEDSPRYRVLPESEHQCCWDASVVDVTKPTMFTDGHFRNRGFLSYDSICEGTLDECVRIAEAMNKEVN